MRPSGVAGPGASSSAQAPSVPAARTSSVVAGEPIWWLPSNEPETAPAAKIKIASATVRGSAAVSVAPPVEPRDRERQAPGVAADASAALAARGSISRARRASSGLTSASSGLIGPRSASTGPAPSGGSCWVERVWARVHRHSLTGAPAR